MKWTTELPTEAGWYWVFISRSKKHTMEHVEVVKGDAGVIHEVVGYDSKGRTIEPLQKDAFLKRYWMGLLIQPPPPPLG